MFIRTLTGIFWHNSEERLRMGWRLCLHTLLLVSLTLVFSVVLILVMLPYHAVFSMEQADVFNVDDLFMSAHDSWIGLAVTAGGSCFGILSATLICARWVDRRNFKGFGFHLSRDWWLDFGFGLVLGAFLMGLIFLFGRLTGTIRINGFFQSYSEGRPFLSGFIEALIKYILVGFYEELMSRGYYLVNLAEGLKFKNLSKRQMLILAWIVSSVVFGLLHIGNPHASWISTLNIILAGLFLGVGMILTGRLSIPIGLHIMWNFFQGNVFGFPVSGMTTGASLIATEMVGPTWLTGGDFGPEAGVMGLAAMVVGSLLIVLWVRRKGKLHLSEGLAKYSPLDIEAAT